MMHWTQKYAGLPALLRELVTETPSTLAVQTIIRASLDYALQLLHWMQHRRSYSFSRMGLTLHDLAHDVVAELLAEGEEGPCTRLRTALLWDAGTADSQLLARFCAVHVRTVQQNLARVFADFDPVRARLLASLRRHVRLSPRYSVIDGISGRLIIAADPAVARLHLPYADESQLLQHADAPRRPFTRPMAAVLDNCCDALAENPGVQCAIYEHDILRIVMTMLGSDLDSVTVDTEELQNDEDSHHIIMLIDNTIEDARTWVFRKFIQPGKLTLGDADAILDACRDALIDTAFSTRQEHFSYLQRYVGNITHHQYRTEYRHRTEYIFRRIFSMMGEHLIKHTMEGSTNTRGPAVSMTHS